MNCNTDIPMPNKLQIGNRKIALTEQNAIYLDRDNIPDAIVMASPKNNGELVIKNISSRTWTVETPSGKLKTVEPQNLMPVKVGLKIKFGSFGSENYTGEIINQ